ncbi:hypothetical protein Pmar_PMAR005436 [Perkinsus marinus ATCC 50983]|uniref:Uncharacterized protein n=1 Tax=Perkinsus marinus (strain ATCC 50983 / TXsc) TaxID=423536 RepID=C5LEP8_PERM5|nr:hypothetical protein Pmar_PMAR005436 [Perkinsus marinus ATCC 50983]EER04798.1 hypothetical protein Pmar_PMAR005436 [Perkinsus marinus ATCC 50983]|eukprot:XP_002772982.1 hypothetical protein Pmar_PMAR005436 [Perkinsus marinus ATCC 50983]
MPIAQPHKSSHAVKQGLGYRQFCLGYDVLPSFAECDGYDVDVDTRPKRNSYKKGRVPMRMFVADEPGLRLSATKLEMVEKETDANLKLPRFVAAEVVAERPLPTRRKKWAKLLDGWEVVHEDDMWFIVEEKQGCSSRRSYADVAVNEMGIDAYGEPHLVPTLLGENTTEMNVKPMRKDVGGGCDDEQQCGDVKGNWEMKFSRSFRGKVEERRRHHLRAERKKERKMKRKAGKA